MSTIVVVELYEAFRAAGVDDAKAKVAAGAVVPRDDFVAKADFEVGLAQLEWRLICWNVGTIIAMAVVFAAIVKFL